MIQIYLMFDKKKKKNKNLKKNLIFSSTKRYKEKNNGYFQKVEFEIEMISN